MLRDHIDYEDAFYYYEFDRKDHVRRIHKETEELENIDTDNVDKMKGYFSESFFLNAPQVNWGNTE
jgi:FAD-dependent urate hydroxylase